VGAPVGFSRGARTWMKIGLSSVVPERTSVAPGLSHAPFSAGSMLREAVRSTLSKSRSLCGNLTSNASHRSSTSPPCSTRTLATCPALSPPMSTCTHTCAARTQHARTMRLGACRHDESRRAWGYQTDGSTRATKGGRPHLLGWGGPVVCEPPTFDPHTTPEDANHEWGAGGYF
jgi:hypothetical protein